METTRFLSRALGTEGFYCVFASRSKDGRRVQKFYSSIDALIHAGQNFDAEGFDVYFALSTFTEDTSRKVNNAAFMRSFFLDLDCGPLKDFPSQVDAISALQQFCRAAKLPRPMMINSGRGVHVYWTLTEQVPVTAWVQAAERLKQLCVAHKFPADPAVTADIARVLRVPDTHNYKAEPPLPVAIFGTDQPEPVSFAEFTSLLGVDMAAILKPVSAAVAREFSAVQNNILSNTENSFKQLLQRTNAGKGCEQIRLIITEPMERSEPIWRAGLSISKFCSDGLKGSYLMSEGHPTYSEESMFEKLEAIKGPYSCVKFDSSRPGVCDKCPLYGQIKNPLAIARHIAEATEEDNIVEVEAPSLSVPNAPTKKYTIPKYPAPYFRGANGGVYYRTKDKDGNPDERLVYHNDIYVVNRIKDPELGEMVVMRLHLPKDGVREFTIALTAVTSKEEFRKAMAKEGVAIMRMDDIMAYTTQWINELQATTSADEAHRQFGWVDKDCSAFVLGAQLIFKDRIEYNAPSSTTLGLVDVFKPRGTLEKWKEPMSFYNTPGFELHQLIALSGLGSVLMHFMPVKAAMMHIHSKDSGFGKTTTQYASLTAWGDPDGLILHKQDTYNSKMHRAEVYCNIPAAFDEITNMKPMEMSDLAYQMTGGRQKNRMSSGANTERLRGRPWGLLCTTSANVSLIETVSMSKSMPRAEAMRVLEVRADRIFKGSIDKQKTDLFTTMVMENYGHAGPLFVQYVMNNKEEVVELLHNVQIKIDTAAGLGPENRFWSAFVACSVTAGIIANRIGLLDFDMKVLTPFVVNQVLKPNMAYSADLTAPIDQVLNDYIHEKWQNILWIKSTQDLRGSHSNGVDSLIVPESQPKGQLLARYETDTKKLYILPKPFKEWCGLQQVNYSSVVEELTKNMNAKKTKIRLSKGTHMNLPPADVLVIDFTVEGKDVGS
jgi:hypothetical protein